LKIVDSPTMPRKHSDWLVMLEVEDENCSWAAARGTQQRSPFWVFGPTYAVKAGRVVQLPST
jgi:hypothetical protein